MLFLQTIKSLLYLNHHTHKHTDVHIHLLAMMFSGQRVCAVCARCVTGVRDWFVEDLAQVWLTRLIYLMLIKTRHGHVISSFSYLCHMINRLFFIFICYMEKMYG